MSDLPISIDASGPIPLTSTELRRQLVAKAQELSPGLTDNLPGSLVEDIVSTDVGALLMCDQMRVDVLNSLGPRMANLHMLRELAEQYGVPGQRSEGLTTVYVEFKGTPGFAIPQGFVISDGTHQYSIQDSVIIPSDGQTETITAFGLTSGQWAVPAHTVNKLVTSVPEDIKLSVNNPADGAPAEPPETIYAFRERVWEAGMSNVSAYPGFIRAELSKVTNIVNRLTSVKQLNNKWYVMCSGGDLYSMAGAIFKSAGDFTRLAAFELTVAMITKGTTTTVTTSYTHGFATGDTIELHDLVTFSEMNDTPFIITVTSPTSFVVPFDSSKITGSFDYTGNVTPNVRAHSVVINDWPDNYTIPFTVPLPQRATVTFKWMNTGGSYLSTPALLALVVTPVMTYINALPSGSPINVNQLKGVFMDAVATLTNATLIDELDVLVTCNDYLAEPAEGKDTIDGDPFSYWYIEKDDVKVS